MNDKPILVVVAGPNGAGKTTFVEKINTDILKKTIFINADNIAKSLKTKHPDKKENQINIMSGKAAINLYEEYLNKKISFSMETTLSGHFPIQILKRAKEGGFETSLIFIGIQDPSNSKIRIENRVLLGGHNVPDEDIIRRHNRSINNLRKAIVYSDKTKIYDNTFNKHQLVLELDGPIIKSMEHIVLPDWFNKVIKPQSLKLGAELRFVP